jgi:hypothetical protein
MAKLDDFTTSLLTNQSMKPIGKSRIRKRIAKICFAIVFGLSFIDVAFAAPEAVRPGQVWLDDRGMPI